MNRFDDDLREALRRKEPPPGFADQVLARTSALDVGPKQFFRWRWRAVAVAAAALVAIAGTAFYQDHRDRVEGERTKQQVMLALRVTGSELRGIQDRLARIQQRVTKVHHVQPLEK